MRTTIDLEIPILRELKMLSKVRGCSLGELTTQLLAEALSSQKAKKTSKSDFQWIARPMGAKVDLADKEALYSVLDRK